MTNFTLIICPDIYSDTEGREDQKIDMRFLLGEFQQLWRENSEIWQERFEYREATPHLILMAFFAAGLKWWGTD